MEIEKAYFTLPEVLDRWRISEADIVYLAENDSLRLSTRVFGVPMEFGDYEDNRDGWHAVCCMSRLTTTACSTFMPGMPFSYFAVAKST